MKTFKQFIIEVLAPEIMKRLVPAIQHIRTGKVFAGKRGNMHLDLYHQRVHPDNKNQHRRDDMNDTHYWNALDKAIDNHHSGFYDHKTRKFYGRGIDHEIGDLDSTDLK